MTYDPFHLEGPAVVSFSGGRTSGYMLRRILDSHGGALPADVHVLFANTGREMPKTLDFVQACGERWNVPIVWLEYCDWEGKPRRLWREVTYDTASRNGEPLDIAIRKKGTLPKNLPGWRFCTSEVKVKTFQRWMKAHGHKEWSNIVGLRFDEPRRVANATAPNDKRGPWETSAPLHEARATRRTVLDFWASQPFDLGLEAYESNCDLCFMKGQATLDRMIRNHPERAEWWIEHERRSGMQFKNTPYAAMVDRVHRLPMLPGIGLDDADETGVACVCTD